MCVHTYSFARTLCDAVHPPYLRGSIYSIAAYALVFAVAPRAVNAQFSDIEGWKASVQVNEGRVSSAVINYARDYYQKATPRSPRTGLPPAVAQRLVDAPEQAVISELNSRIQSENRLLLDVGRQRWREDRSDTRNIDEMLASHALPEAYKSGLSQSKTHLVGSDCCVEYSQLAKRLIISPSASMSGFRPFIAGTPIRTGAIDPRYLSEATHGHIDISIRSSEGPSFEVVLRRRTDTVVFLVDPMIGLGYFQKLQVYVDGKLLYQELASNYRVIDGIPFPYSHSMRRFDGNGTLLLDETITVKNARLNTAIPSDAFQLSLPAGTTVFDARKTGAPFKLRADFSFDFDLVNLLDLQSETDMTEYGLVGQGAPGAVAAMLAATQPGSAASSMPSKRASQRSGDAQTAPALPEGQHLGKSGCWGWWKAVAALIAVGIVSVGGGLAAKQRQRSKGNH